jgi:hypothetical protein
MNDLSSIESIITNLGFPILVALFVLYRLNYSLEKLRTSLDKLCTELNNRELVLKELVLKVDYLEQSVYRTSNIKRRTNRQ